MMFIFIHVILLNNLGKYNSVELKGDIMEIERPKNFFRPSEGRKTNIIVFNPFNNIESIGGFIDSFTLTYGNLKKFQASGLNPIKDMSEDDLKNILILDILYRHRESQGKWRERKFGVAISMRDIHRELNHRGAVISWYEFRKRMKLLLKKKVVGKYDKVNRNPKGMAFRKEKYLLEKKSGGPIDLYFLEKNGAEYVHMIKRDLYLLLEAKKTAVS